MSIVPYSPTFDAGPIERADIAETTKRQYKRAIALMILARVNPFDSVALANYAAGLQPSARAFLKAALRIMSAEALRRAQAGATVENLAQVEVLWHRVQAMSQAIATNQPEPERTPHWLTQAQVDQLIESAASERDRIVLSMLAGTGLRREELSELTFESLSLLDGVDILTVRGKGDHVRHIPITATLAGMIRAWGVTIGGGRIARSVDRHGNLGESLSPSGIYDLVGQYGALIGIQDLQPHDIRRTFGRLEYQKCLDIVRVQNLLGHANSKTTQRYIGLYISLSPVDIVKGA